MNSRVFLSLIGLVISVPAALGVLISAFRPKGIKPGLGANYRAYLAPVFGETAAFFLSEFLSAGSGPSPLSLALNLGIMFLGPPALYLFERGLLGEPEQKPALHFALAALNAPIGVAAALDCAARGFSGGLGLTLYVATALTVQSIQLIVYGRLGLSAAKRAGTAWPRRVALAVIGGYTIFLSLSWVSFLQDMASDILGYPPPQLADSSLSALIVAVLQAWTLGLCVLWGKDTVAGMAAQKYGGRPLLDSESTALVARLREIVAEEADLASPKVAPRRLATRLGTPYYLLSRAVNEREGMTIGDFVNEYRIARAKKLLVENPEMNMLEVSMEAGFSAKSTFNEVFRRKTGTSPRDFRRNAAGGGAPRT